MDVSKYPVPSSQSRSATMARSRLVPARPSSDSGLSGLHRWSVLAGSRLASVRPRDAERRRTTGARLVARAHKGEAR